MPLDGLRERLSSFVAYFRSRHLSSSEVLKGVAGAGRDAKDADIHEHLKRRKKQDVPARRISTLRFYLAKAGINVDSEWLSIYAFRAAVLINLLLSAFLIYRFSHDNDVSVVYVAFMMAVIWILIFIGILLIVWFSIYVLLDLRSYKRRVDIEEVLPDFLQLTAANIRAGMPIDRALWYAVRPRFGVLASEIEMVAKETMSGEDLDAALLKFTNKYDSMVLKRAINMLIESSRAGGEVGDILNKIAENIKENQIMRKEMSANVTAYAMFIGFATLVASPMLFALSGEFLSIITGILSRIDFADVQSSGTAGFSLAFSEPGISQSDFRIFSIVSLLVTAAFSAAIVATIRKGDIKSGMNYFPAFIGITLGLYFLWSFMAHAILQSIF